jgi:RimJ/RimL family protein N-acetyltransferase
MAGMLREATVADLSALTELEREANLAALGHVFPPERYPFPADDVLARWALVLREPGVHVLVRDAEPSGGASRVDVFAAYDATTLRHLAVHPRLWGRGLASGAIQAALEAMDASGTTIAQLWCLEENHRARRLYEYLGWRPAQDRRPAPWPPHPTEMRYTRLIPQSDR